MQLAYARMGQGPPLVKTGHWMTHIEFDFESPIWRHLYQELSRDHAFYRYDARGNGLSDREVPDVTFEDFVDDLEAVVDAAGIERFALLGISQGCAVSIAYAVRHPERVSHLILLGGYAVGWKKRARTEAERQAGEAMLTLMRSDGARKTRHSGRCSQPSSFRAPPRNRPTGSMSFNGSRVRPPTPRAIFLRMAKWT